MNHDLTLVIGRADGSARAYRARPDVWLMAVLRSLPPEMLLRIAACVDEMTATRLVGLDGKPIVLNGHQEPPPAEFTEDSPG